MRTLLLLLVVVAAAGMLLPQWREGTADACAALDLRLRLIVAAAAGGLPPAAAREARAEGPRRLRAALDDMVRGTLPALPAPVVCAAGYWIAVLRPGLARMAVTGAG